MSKELRQAAENAAFIFEAILELKEVGTYRSVMNQLKAAIEAEPIEQEPVAYATSSKYQEDLEWNRNIDIHSMNYNRQPLYTHPATNEVSGYPKPFELLSDDEVEWLMFNKVPYGLGKKGSYTAFANAIQDAIAEKNK